MPDSLNISTSKNKKLEYKYTNEELKKLQSMNLEDKIALSLTRIAEFYNRFSNKIYNLSYHFIISLLNSFLFSISAQTSA